MSRLRLPGTGARAPRVASDGGQTLPLVALVLVVALGAVVVLGQVGRVLDDRAQARTAADAAALAGAVEGAAGAEDLARRNGATLEDVTVRQGITVVRVRVGWVTASAAATLDHGGTGSIP